MSARPTGQTIGKGAPVNLAAAPLSVVGLFLHADIVVKGVMLLLLAASVWSWAVIAEKLWSLGRASRNARDHEARVLAAHSPQELLAAAGRTELGDPTALVIAAGWAEASVPKQDLPETAVERRVRIERAMRLARPRAHIFSTMTVQLHTEAASSSSITPLTTMSACRKRPTTESGAGLAVTGAPLPIALKVHSRR